MSIEKKKNGTYQVRFRDISKRQRAKSFKRKRDAEAFQAKVITEVKTGVWLDPVVASVKLEEVWTEFADLKRGKKRKTQLDYEDIWRIHLKPNWGKVSVAQIDQIDFDKWVILRNLSEVRIDKIHLVMSMLLDHAVKRKYLRSNPLKNSEGKRIKENLPVADRELATNYWTLTELLRVAQMSGFYRAAVLVLGLCGLRWAELVGLQVKDLNVSAGTITIRRSISEINGRLEVNTTKSKRWRIIKLPEVLHSICHRWVIDKTAEDPLFHTESGTLLRNTNFTRRVFLPATRLANVKVIRIHDLRHTAASIAISAGASPRMVQEMLGHSDVETTMRIYAHIFEADREKVASNLNRAVDEVHQMCTDPYNYVQKMDLSKSNYASQQDFFLKTVDLVELGTSDYESGALTN